jgi:hypothetical protein
MSEPSREPGAELRDLLEHRLEGTAAELHGGDRVDRHDRRRARLVEQQADLAHARRHRHAADLGVLAHRGVDDANRRLPFHDDEERVGGVAAANDRLLGPEADDLGRFQKLREVIGLERSEERAL